MMRVPGLPAAPFGACCNKVGNSCDNAPAARIIGLIKTEVIRRPGPWRKPGTVEIATPDRVDRFNCRRLLEPVGNIPPTEANAHGSSRIGALAMVA